MRHLRTLTFHLIINISLIVGMLVMVWAFTVFDRNNNGRTAENTF
jgi:hypothetical protein